jgi:hypothetical protein
MFLNVKQTFATLKSNWEKWEVWRPIEAKLCTAPRLAQQDDNWGTYVNGLCQPDNVPLHYSSRGTVLKNCFHWWQRKLWALWCDATFSTTVGHNIYIQEAATYYDDAAEYTLVSWLIRGAALSRLFHLGNGTDIFTMKQGKTVPWLSEKKWVMTLVITVHETNINEFNKYFQLLNLPPHQLIYKRWETSSAA